jgi:hypothetical protein
MLNIEGEKIHVIYQGVNHSLYRPMDKESCRKHSPAGEKLFRKHFSEENSLYFEEF